MSGSWAMPSVVYQLVQDRLSAQAAVAATGLATGVPFVKGALTAGFAWLSSGAGAAAGVLGFSTATLLGSPALALGGAEFMFVGGSLIAYTARTARDSVEDTFRQFNRTERGEVLGQRHVGARAEPDQ